MANLQLSEVDTSGNPSQSAAMCGDDSHGLESSEQTRSIATCGPETDVADQFVAQFATFTSITDQRLALQKLFVSLERSQKRHFVDWVGQLDLRFDILGNVPYDVYAMIASHLTLRELVQARRVCQHWANMLASSQTSERFLRDWFRGADASVHVPVGLSSRAASAYKAEHIDAFQNGAAFDMSVFQVGLPKIIDLEKAMTYASGKLAWISQNRRDAHVLDLDSGAERVLAPFKHLVSFLGISSTMLAMMTGGCFCRVHKLKEEGFHDFILPSLGTHSVTVGLETVACLFKPSATESSKSKMQLMVWSLTSQHMVTSFHFLNHPYDDDHSHDVKLMTVSDKPEVIIFERNDINSTIYFTRKAKQGETIASGELEFGNMTSYSRCSEEIVLQDHGTWNTLWSYAQPREGEEDHLYMEIVRIQFKAEANELRITTDTATISPSGPTRFAKIHFWNDVAYCRDIYDSKMYIINFQTSTVKAAVMSMDTRFSSLHPALKTKDGVEGLQCLGDQRFLINGSKAGFLVWCFDKNNNMRSKDSTYQWKLEDAKLKLKGSKGKSLAMAVR